MSPTRAVVTRLLGVPMVRADENRRDATPSFFQDSTRREAFSARRLQHRK